MKKMVNEVRVIGRLYSSELKEATVQNKESSVFGKNYINGTINIATDEDNLNVIPITFTFVTETTKKGGPNPTYVNLKKIMNDESIKTVSKDGKDAATIVEVRGSQLSVDDRYNTTTNEFKAWTNNSGGFVSFKNKNDLPAAEEDRNSFDADIVITSFNRVPEDTEKNITEHGIVHGAIFSYNNSILPIDFKVTSSGGMDYFESLGVSNSNPVFTKVHGMVINNRIVTQVEENSAFGKPIINTSVKTTRDWVITSAIENPYDFGAEGVLTTEELTKAMQDREIHLAKVKQDAEEYAAKKENNSNNGPTAPAIGTVAAGNFKF
jgi:hypothetical protein